MLICECVVVCAMCEVHVHVACACTVMCGVVGSMWGVCSFVWCVPWML